VKTLSRRSRTLGAALAILAASAPAFAQDVVYPRNADKSQVRYFDYNWRHVDILVGPQAERKMADPDLPRAPDHPAQLPPAGEGVSGTAIFSPSELSSPPDPPGGEGPSIAMGPAPDGGTPAPDAGTPRPSPWLQTAPDGGLLTDGGVPLPPRSGGVRLYFYDREAEVAERAAAQITSAYRHLVDQFEYVPTKTFPYILYNSYREFLETNLFPLQEGTLGVTSPVDLKLTLPYFGDHRLFELVSLHEMAHQFTIQKVRTVMEDNKLAGNPLEGIPLWFIEGLAEYYAQHGIDPEAEMLIRDLVVNPSLEKGYAMLDFFEDRPQSGLWTYKVGQIRCGFLEETYGQGMIQRILSSSGALAGAGMMRRQTSDFGALLEKLTGDDSRTISRKFETWLKRRSFKAYLGSSQDVPEVKPLPEFQASSDALATSPSGDLLLYRTMEPETYRAKLILADRRSPSHGLTVATDGVPGVESLHLVFGRSFDVGKDALIYVAEANGEDLIYWQRVNHVVEEREADATPSPFSVAANPNLPKREEEPWSVSISLGEERYYRLRQHGIIAAFGPSLAVDGQRIAFVGLAENGVRDIYVLTPRGTGGPEDYDLTRVTDDTYAERQVAWGPEDTLVFNSDATGHGKFNLFRAKLSEPGKVERLTSEARDHTDPEVLPDGRIFFVAFNRGSSDIHEVVGSQVVRRTDIATGLFDVNAGPDGGLWALFHHAGERQPVLIKKDQLIEAEAVAQPAPDAPRELSRTPLADAQAYSQYSPQNWELGNPYAFVSGGLQGIYGQVFANAEDRLRNHALILFAAVYGSFDLTDGFLVYLNQERRVTWGAGVFQSVRLRYDRTYDIRDLAVQILSGERYYGALGSLRYPFNQFVYLQADFSVGGVSYFLSPVDKFLLATPEWNGSGRDLLSGPQGWYALNNGPRAQTEASLRFGFDTLRYHPLTGPIDGTTVLLEVTGGIQPFNGETYGAFRLDAAHYIPIEGRAHVMIRGGAGSSVGGRYSTSFQLSSFDTIRGVPFTGSTLRQWLFGRNYFFSTAELQVPLNNFVRLILFSDIEAIAAVDFGGVSDDPRTLLHRRVLDYVLGVNFALGPLLFRLHFAKPVGIGARPAFTLTTNGMPSGGRPCAPSAPPDVGGCPAEPVGDSEWVTNFSIGLVGFPGFFRPADTRHRAGSFIW
jgi:hypothetical protein